HAWCLMTNHVHLLVTPECDTGISNFMKVVCSRYAQYINKNYLRTGTLWEGRHKASAVESRTYLLKCYRYIELNPVAAMMVSQPAEYRWSSYGANAWGENDQLITPHEDYLELSSNRLTRQASYRELFNSRLTDEDVKTFRKAAHYSMPVGSPQFHAQLEARLGRPLGQASRGRPRRQTG
ncbi:MAG: transposase, partial [Pseudohongiellaceae bacterium]